MDNLLKNMVSELRNI